jgi:hypothetical protein
MQLQGGEDMRRKARITATVSAVALTAVLAGCGSTATLEHIPYHAPNADLILRGMGVYSVAGDDVTGFVRVETVHIPKRLEAYASIWFKYRGKWLEEDERNYGVGALALPGHTRTLTPELAAACTKGLWAEEIHIVATTSKGEPATEYLVWPGDKTGKRKKSTFLGSNNIIPKKDWPGEKLACRK